MGHPHLVDRNAAGVELDEELGSQERAVGVEPETLGHEDRDAVEEASVDPELQLARGAVPHPHGFRSPVALEAELALGRVHVPVQPVERPQLGVGPLGRVQQPGEERPRLVVVAELAECRDVWEVRVARGARW